MIQIPRNSVISSQKALESTEGLSKYSYPYPYKNKQRKRGEFEIEFVSALTIHNLEVLIC